MRKLYWKIGRKLYLKGRKDDIKGSVDTSEKKLIKDLMGHFSKSKVVTFFDIGANIGDWSLYCYDLFKSGDTKIDQYLFEPIPRTYKELVGNVTKTGATIENMAISDSTGEVTMFEKKEDFAGTNSMYNTGLENADEKKVRSMTLHDYFDAKKIEYIDFVKCDAEGHDFKIIAGAKSLFDNECIGFFQFEYNHRWIYGRSFLKDVFDLVSPTNYEVAKITKDGIELYTEWHFELEKYYQSNFVILHKSLISQVPNLRKGKIGKGNVFVAFQS